MFHHSWSPSDNLNAPSPTSTSLEDRLGATEDSVTESESDSELDTSIVQVESSVDFERESQVPPEFYELNFKYADMQMRKYRFLIISHLSFQKNFPPHNSELKMPYPSCSP
jgi:hypothetical protein